MEALQLHKYSRVGCYALTEKGGWLQSVRIACLLRRTQATGYLFMHSSEIAAIILGLRTFMARAKTSADGTCDADACVAPVRAGSEIATINVDCAGTDFGTQRRASTTVVLIVKRRQSRVV